MLNEILSTLKAHQAEDTENGGLNVGINERNILTLIANSPTVTVREMADMLGFSLRQCERLIAEMKRKNLIKRTGLHIPADTRSAFPVISVHSPVSIQCRWQS